MAGYLKDPQKREARTQKDVGSRFYFNEHGECKLGPQERMACRDLRT